MTRKIIALVIISAIALATSCTSGKHKELNTYADFERGYIGVISGMICDQIVEDDLHGIPAYYADLESALADIRSGEIDGFMIDLSIATVFTGTAGNEDLKVVKVPVGVFEAPLGAVSADSDIINDFNVFLSRIRTDGSFYAIQRRWLEDIPTLSTTIPEIDASSFSGSAEPLIIATSGAGIPFSYTNTDGGLSGFAVELALWFAAYRNQPAEFVTMDFSELITAAQNGKVDIAIDGISITHERRQLVLFTDSFYDDGLGIISLK
ncbi:MAG: transporter substrate-binding domain-containing protein [Oscillospiraceae bacterium]|nr:transporter substrate-binding domain-containing protein [Oscillospiraceae bacterium]